MKQSKIATATKIAAITLSAVLLFGCDDDTTTDTTTTTTTDTSSFPDTIDEFNFSSATSPFANSGDSGETELRINGGTSPQVITATTNYDGVANTAIHHDQGLTNTTTTVGNLKYSADSTKTDVGSLTGSFSIEAVIKVSDRVMSNDSDIVAFFGDSDATTYGGFKIYLESSSPNINQVKFKLYGTDSSDSSLNKNTEVKAAAVLTVDVWQHVMAVYDSETDTASLYLDGVLSSSTELEADKGVVLVKNPTADDDFTVLGGSSSSDKNFDGDVDNVATWNVALTSDQVSERAAEFGF